MSRSAGAPSRRAVTTTCLREREHARRVALAALFLAAFALAGASTARAAFPGAIGKIFFTSTQTGNYEIYSMSSVDGSGQTDLTNNPASDISPAVSPDGQKVAFTSFRDGGNAEIYVMNADG